MGNPLSIATASGPAKFVKISMRPSPSAREAGMVKSSPQNLIAQGTDWRFLDQLKKEMKA